VEDPTTVDCEGLSIFLDGAAVLKREAHQVGDYVESPINSEEQSAPLTQ
jgi:hypothetical protein